MTFYITGLSVLSRYYSFYNKSLTNGCWLKMGNQGRPVFFSLLSSKVIIPTVKQTKGLAHNVLALEENQLRDTFRNCQTTVQLQNPLAKRQCFPSAPYVPFLLQMYL